MTKPNSFKYYKSSPYIIKLAIVTAYALKRFGITRKKTTLYAERDEEKRRDFLSEIKQIEHDQLVWLDESGIDEFLQRDYANLRE